MKKFIAIVLVLAILGACGYAVFKYFDSQPYIKDLEVAKENLEAADYLVSLSYEGDKLAYLPSYAVKYLTATDGDDNSIDIIVYKDKEIAKIEYENNKYMLEMMKESISVQLDTINYVLENNDELTEAEIESYNENKKDYAEALEKLETLSIGISGCTVWIGTEDAIKASKAK